ncbi:hypothetical protein ATC04_05640 [Arthrobacter sp. YC-RL1]|uniref:Rha family transcriptional regulator n=1 Tax=Arthrobacter sp. YC-RL1 TaxID=1652545 RepID=UPI00069C7DEA|nr:Rha family transcriptional regulator [Arthrobacter sp. YC-RL1]ALQ30088.1 hypothetical protein ATC04_05640 [Arthrobacter sp. YC-RL1]
MTTTIVPTIENTDNGLVVSSVTIANGTDNQHKSIVRLVRDNLSDFEEFGRVGFENAPFETAGGIQTRAIAKLNEPQSTLLMTYLRNNDKVKAFKKALVKAFYEMAEQLKSQAFNPASLSRTDILRMALESETRAIAAEAKIEQDAGKVAYVDTHVKPENVQPFNTVAKNLGINVSDLRRALIYRHWIYVDGYRISKDGVRANRYSAYQNKNYPKYFKHCVTHEVARLNGTPWHTLKITPEGVAAVTRLNERLTAEYGSLREALPELEAKYNKRKGIAA